MSTNRTHVTRTEFNALKGDVAKILALLETNAPAKAPVKATPKPKARKATRKAAPKVTPKVTKGATALRTGAGMTKAEWNKTLSTKARLAGKRDGVSVYSVVMGDWAEVQALRSAGVTPDEALSLYV